MRSSQVLVLAGVSAASARDFLDRFAAPTPVLVKRDEAECSSVILELMPSFTNVPTPDPELIQYIEEEFATITDACEIPEFTGEAGEMYTSWLSEMEAYYLAMTDEVSSIMAACTDVPGIEDQFDYNPEDNCDNGFGDGPTEDDDDSTSDDDSADDDDSVSPTPDDSETPTETDGPAAETDDATETDDSETPSGTGDAAAESEEADSSATRERATMVMGGLIMAAFVAVGLL